MTKSESKFTAHKHPVQAVACPDCQSSPGSWCKRPSGHKASDFHKSRKILADKVFINDHGEAATIARTKTGWTISS